MATPSSLLLRRQCTCLLRLREGRFIVVGSCVDNSVEICVCEGKIGVLSDVGNCPNSKFKYSYFVCSYCTVKVQWVLRAEASQHLTVCMLVRQGFREQQRRHNINWRKKGREKREKPHGFQWENILRKPCGGGVPCSLTTEFGL